MGTPTVFSNVPQALDAANRELFVDGMVSSDVAFPLFFADRGRSGVKLIQKSSILPAGAYAAHSTGADIPTSPIEDGVQVTYDHDEYSIGYEVAAGVLDFMDPRDLPDFIRSLGGSLMQLYDGAMMGVFGNGFTAVGYDGETLFSASHPRGDGSGATVSNYGTTGFDIDAVEATVVAGLQMVSPEGLKDPRNYDTILVPVQKALDGERIKRDLLKTDTTGTIGDNNLTNVVASRIKAVVASPQLSDANDWMMIDSATWRGEFYPTKASNIMMWLDQDSGGNLKITDRVHFAYGHRNSWRAAYGHKVS